MRDGEGGLDPTDMHIVGLAASAGGLEAVTLLAQNLQPDTQAAFVLAQHVSPSHESLLHALISRETRLSVVELQDPVAPEPGTIYITPPNNDVILDKGFLHLRAPSGLSSTPKPSADRLFKSIANERGPKSVAIVLSGTGNDGSYGVQSIREAGGITIAQDPASAKYVGMPTAAIQTNCIDLTLAPTEVGEHLKNIIGRSESISDYEVLAPPVPSMETLLKLIHRRMNVDFRDYKESTISRRIAHRMVALGIENFDEYVHTAQASPKELEALYKDLLISVTRFFRDTEHFHQLDGIVRQVVSSSSDRQIRVWIGGCASGEEVYSIAMLFAEALGGLGTFDKRRIQVFATDIDERALAIARRGLYPVSAAADIPEKLRSLYTRATSDQLEITPELRGIVLFSKHNIIQDAPFINLDMVSLRNVLIYLNPKLQDRVLGRIHYALNSGGYLFLGTSESVGSMHPYFEAIVDTDKIFSKRLITQQGGPLPRLDPTISTMPQLNIARQPTTETLQDNSLGMFDALAKTVAPNGFIATAQQEIIRVFGDISHVLQITEKSALRLSTRTLKNSLRDEASSLIALSLKHQKTRKGRWHDIEGIGFDQIRLRAFPVLSHTGGEHNVLFSVEERITETTHESIEELPDAERIKHLNQVEAEMAFTRESLQHTVEELQASNEELQSVNEELQSTNEELQATNEQLETYNEELQSTNQELITVNDEMQVNSVELQIVSAELASVLVNSAHAVLVIDLNLCVRHLSKRAGEVYELPNQPRNGLHVSQCHVPAGVPPLSGICSRTLSSGEPQLEIIKGEDGERELGTTPIIGPLSKIIGLQLRLSEPA